MWPLCLPAVHNALHGSAAQAGVPRHDRHHAVAGQNARQQACRRAGVAHIQHICWFTQLANAQPAHAPVPRRILRNIGPQGAHGRCGAQHVLALQKPGDMCFPPREGGKHERTVADGFVTRHTDGTGKRSLRARDPQRTGGGGGCVCHALFIPAGWPASQSGLG